MKKTVLILGASGKIGTHAAAVFSAAGWTVIRFNRETDSMLEKAKTADIIINGFNPPNYKNWEQEVPRYTAQIIEAAKASGATIIVPGNVYVYAAKSGVWGPATPHAATTRKGRIRIEMERAYRDSAEDGVQTIMLRAGDFIDPNGAETLMGQVMVKKIEKGVLTHLGPPDVRRAYCYLPDWARIALALAEKRHTLDAYVDIPVSGLAYTTNELRDLIKAATGRRISLAKFPWWFLQLTSPFWNLAKEMLEMRYLYETSHELASEPLNKLVPDFVPTPPQNAVLAELPKFLMNSSALASKAP